jgi:hypothetical protein
VVQDDVTKEEVPDKKEYKSKVLISKEWMIPLRTNHQAVVIPSWPPLHTPAVLTQGRYASHKNGDQEGEGSKTRNHIRKLRNWNCSPSSYGICGLVTGESI